LSQQGFVTSGLLKTDARIPLLLQHYLEYLRCGDQTGKKSWVVNSANAARTRILMTLRRRFTASSKTPS
jgi:hypothetical protein